MTTMVERFRRDLALMRGDPGREDALLISARILCWLTLIAVAATLAVTLAELMAEITRASMIERDKPWIPAALRIAGAALSVIALITVGGLLGRLLDIIATVAQSRPFDPANVKRIEAVAEAVLGFQFLGLFATLIGAPIGGWIAGVELSLRLSPWGIVLVVILYVLARVFREGLRLSDDAAGTV